MPLASQQELIRNKLMPESVAAGNEASLVSLGLNVTSAGPFGGASAGNCVMSAAFHGRATNGRRWRGQAGFT